MHAGVRQFRTERLKDAQLFFGLFAGVIGGRRKVGHQTFQPDVLSRADRLQNLRRRRARAQPSHATVDFQMIVRNDGTGARHAIPFRNVPEGVNHRRKVVVEKAGSFGGQEIRHH